MYIHVCKQPFLPFIITLYQETAMGLGREFEHLTNVTIKSVELHARQLVSMHGATNYYIN